MALIASISGIRGTIGGQPGHNLTPLDITQFVAAYGTWLKARGHGTRVVIGRDARISGEMLRALVVGSLQAVGLDVVDLGLSTTPTVEIAVTAEQAAGGIILTASHNPIEWNALKLLNERGEFISAADGAAVMQIYADKAYDFVDVHQLGRCTQNATDLQQHIDDVLALPLVRREAIAAREYKVVVDAVNSTGGVFVPELLRQLGVRDIVELNCVPNGHFAHNPEPLRENLNEICDFVARHPGHIGIVVDPDVDRLVLVMENGELFGEEYTLVAVADYVLQHHKGAAVSNLSSSRALRDVAQRHGCAYHSAAVGEVNVVEVMKATQAAIGGEGNGGIIYPELHHGRDALVGIALVLSHMATAQRSLTQLRASYPAYYMAKQKITLVPGLDVDAVLAAVASHYAQQQPDLRDGVKVDWADRWAHLRKSNTEPIIRIYTEAPTQTEAEALAAEVQAVAKKFV